MNIHRFSSAVLSIVLFGLASAFSTIAQDAVGTVTEIALAYPNPPVITKCMHHGSAAGSTHEITFNEKGGKEIWITGQNDDAVVRISLDGKTVRYYQMPPHSGPHGIEFDRAGRVWVTLEFADKVVRLDANGKIDKEYDVNLACSTCPQKIDTHPHSMGFDPKGNIWFTGKSTGTVGKITPDGKIQTYGLPTVGSVPIYIRADAHGDMWVTELVGNMIARVSLDGKVEEFCIPTPNSRPIAIVPDPDGKGMWFTEEAGNKVGHIDKDGTITEYPIPKMQSNVILAGLSFDSEKNLWVQQYVDQSNPMPEGPDHIVKIDRSIRHASPSDMSRVPITFYAVPTRNTVFHRIIEGPDGNMWFTEMKADKIGKLSTRSRP